MHAALWKEYWRSLHFLLWMYWLHLTFYFYQSDNNCFHSMFTVVTDQNKSDVRRDLLKINNKDIKSYFILYIITNRNKALQLVSHNQLVTKLEESSLQIEGILPKGPYPPCLRMADRAPYAWRVGPFWQDTLEMRSPWYSTNQVQGYCGLVMPYGKWLVDCSAMTWTDADLLLIKSSGTNISEFWWQFKHFH